MLIHQLSGSDNGKFYELQDQMTNMNILMNTIGNIYLNKTNIDLTDLFWKIEIMDYGKCKA